MKSSGCIAERMLRERKSLMKVFCFDTGRMPRRKGEQNDLTNSQSRKKTVVSINTVRFGSTGGIMTSVSDAAERAGWTCYTAFAKTRGDRGPFAGRDILISNAVLNSLAIRINRLLGFNGCYAWIETALFLQKLRRLNPDIVHLHNLHNCYINLPMLFGFLKKRRIPVVWTLHDCWAFTGQCPHFALAQCEKWKTGCRDCPQYRLYPECRFDRTKTMYRLKKRWFLGVENMTLVTPSNWLAGLVKQSFLRQYPVRVIHNGADLSVFRPMESRIREERGLGGKYLLLGVAFGWGERKGLDVFIELARRLDGRYRIVLVGTDDEADKQLPGNILSIHRTQDRTGLAKLYTAADVFVNPTREENYPTVNMEALACGTPVIAFDTGGSPEIPDETCGRIVPWGDVDALEAGVRDICENARFSEQACLTRARLFDEREKYQEYVALYQTQVAATGKGHEEETT